MIRMLLMSARLGTALFHQLGEAIEQIPDVVRPWTRLRMPLKAERGSISPGEPLEGTVEEGYVRRPQILRDGGRINGEAMVLAGDDHAPGVEVLHRVVRAVVPELHLHGLRARGEAHELVAEADAEHRQPRGVEDLADRLDGVVAGLGIAGPVREEYSIGLHSENLACRCLCGDYSNARAAVGEHAQDVVLHAIVACDDVEPRVFDSAVTRAAVFTT